MNSGKTILMTEGKEELKNRLEKLMALKLKEERISLTFTEFGKAKEKLLEKSWDLFLVSLKSFDYKDIQFLMEQSTLKLDIVLLVPEEQYDYVFYKTCSAGILTVKDSIPESLLSEVIRSGLHSSYRKRKADFSPPEKQKEIRLVDTAKLLLITNEGKTEDEAHKAIERCAMDLRITKLRAAETIIGRYIRYE